MSSVMLLSHSYLRFAFKDKSVHCCFIMERSRIALIKTLTIPQLELNAAVIGVRLYNIVIHEINLPIEKVKFWSDLTLTLRYINIQSHCFKIYVDNKVTQILKSTSADGWNYIEGAKNPAGTCSRGVSSPMDLLTIDKYGEGWIS